jgi:hypothetical protein
MSDHARMRNHSVRAYVVKVKEAYVAGAGCSGYMRFKREIANEMEPLIGARGVQCCLICYPIE